MSVSLLFNKISSLSPEMIREVDEFVDFLKTKRKIKEKKEREFGIAKGKIVIHPDFDEPLKEFEEYMQ